ncbi:MAG: hypothetical protein HQ582_30965 [Planctomycetes bacterium]|nr:hypothetical protein [Planctomycetota bacterium]
MNEHGCAAAAVPPMPFLFLALETVSDRVKSVILETISCFTRVSGPKEDHYAAIRVLNLSWTEIGEPPKDLGPRDRRVCGCLLDHRTIIERLLVHEVRDVAEWAVLIVGTFRETPERTAAVLIDSLNHATDRRTRRDLLLTVTDLQWPDRQAKLERLLLDQCQDEVDRSMLLGPFVAGSDQPPQHVVEELKRLVLSPSEATLEAWQHFTGWKNFFIHNGLPLVLSHPDLYPDVLRRYTEWIEQKGSAWDDSLFFLAFALCFHQRRRPDSLSPAQLRAVRAISKYASSDSTGSFNLCRRDLKLFHLPPRIGT